ncbi:MAG: hypothetical protein FWF59_08685 [Turicibacter sp.]|nr:hypothetical protein [Turicibacter sp.]
MQAFEVERLVDEVGADVYRFCRKLCGSKPDSEDLYQQTFLKLLDLKQKLAIQL